ncbi:incomplete iron reductase [Abortiporus biennis]|nr:incomplete iron reductase [Abortiporus biennis]
MNKSTHPLKVSSDPLIAANPLFASAFAGLDSFPFDHDTFVQHIDIFLLASLAVLVLFSVPRALVRFSRGEQWTTGHLLRHVNIQQLVDIRPAPVITWLSPAQLGRGKPKLSVLTDEKMFGSSSRVKLDRNNSKGSAKELLLRNDSTSSGRVRRTHYNPPKHIAHWSSFYPQVSRFLSYPLRPSLSVEKVILLIGYAVLVLYASSYRSDPFTQPVRTGWVAASQIPVVLILGTKNNLVSMMLGMGYEKLNYLHRYTGRLLIIAVNVHALGYFYSWSLTDTFWQHIKVEKFHAGLVAFIGANLLYFFSLSIWRQSYFNLFIFSHVATVLIFIIGTWYHSAMSVPYLILGLGIYGLDRAMRILKTRYSVAGLNTLTELGMTRVEIPGINAGWKAGQHVRIRILSRGMGLLGWTESHPFTIASVDKGVSGEGLVLLCKKTGNWTNKLYDLAKRAEYSEAGGYMPNVKILVEGPYGGPGHTIFASFSGALLVAGGSGITFALGMFQDLIRKDLEGESRLKDIELVWVVQDPTWITPLLSLFTDLLAVRTYAFLHVSLYYTRAPSESSLKALDDFSLPTNLTINPGRPRLAQRLSNVLDQTCALSMFRRGARRSVQGEPEERLAGVIVSVCGPLGLAEDVRGIVRNVDPYRRKAAGGIEIHEEIFGS